MESDGGTGQLDALSGPERLTYTAQETAARLGVSVWSVYEQARRGALPAVRLGRRVLIPRVALEEWAARRQAEAADEPLRVVK